MKEKIAYPEAYRVIKIYDFRTSKPCYDKRMYGQAATAFVATEKAKAMLADKGGIHRHVGEYPFDDIWEKQMELVPKIGLPVLFISHKPDAGYFRSAEVVAFQEYPGVAGFSTPRLIIQTLNSLYLVEVDD